MVRREDGRPWFIHGVGFDITELKQTEAALAGERNLLSAVLDTVGALVVVLSPSGSIIRFNRTCELISGYSFDEVRGRYFWDLFPVPEEARGFRALLAGAPARASSASYESDWTARDGARRRIAWSSTVLPGTGAGTGARHHHAESTSPSGSEMESALLEISGREQRQIGQDLHDGLGQHLTGIAFMSKVLEQQLAEAGAAAGGPRGQDRAAGERRDQQDPRAGPRPGAGVLRRPGPHVRAPAVGGGGRGPVPPSPAGSSAPSRSWSPTSGWPRTCTTSRRRR